MDERSDKPRVGGRGGRIGPEPSVGPGAGEGAGKCEVIGIPRLGSDGFMVDNARPSSIIEFSEVNDTFEPVGVANTSIEATLLESPPSSLSSSSSSVLLLSMSFSTNFASIVGF